MVLKHPITITNYIMQNTVECIFLASANRFYAKMKPQIMQACTVFLQLYNKLCSRKFQKYIMKEMFVENYLTRRIRLC